MKNLKTIIATLLVVITGWFGYQQFGVYTVGDRIIIAGSSKKFTKFPISQVDASTTSTVGLIDGGLINQEIKSEGVEKGLLCGAFKGGTATSTFSLKQMGSFDGIDWFNQASTTIEFPTNTTTISISNTILTFDPGTSTTTNQCWMLNVEGYVKTRFIFMGEDVSTDPNDGVKGWLEWWAINKP